ncbi:sugar phosphate nucleotidyltransferase [Weizmannia sp. CD-2023]|uniref:sugar phosphate nucleotidyltransferase n=1 Tax=Heyndrickxia TaxID=2837504 RepID=UPI002E2059FE|nr:sugar phosphate nucleotidyltransferase [Weizmannia sp. CD-2023]MED4841404.1 sugar phosphate nucleotidyltransferase [Weizmannia sp. CD-2023]MED4900977.1 sugar phosphate nucleotidyltransferase [Weizmannia sp. CD-2023]
MKLILLSGGSGKRLWPLSNESRSKQFLKVLEDKDKKLQSMVQRVWQQLKISGLQESTLIATSKSQVDMIKSQLNNNVELIVEPSRRDTFPAISLAAAYLYSKKDIDLNEVIAVLPVDPYVEIEFFYRVKELEEIIQNELADIALLGVCPTYPSEKYGYIVPSNGLNGNNTINVSRFIEKPNEEVANKLISQGALWNCGVFAFKLGYLIKILNDNHYPTDYNVLLKDYNKLPKISFDYEVVEKTKNIVALSYQGDWKDLGTWNTLTEEMGTNQIGKGVISEDCANTHLINELDIPVTILGISNAVVAVSPDGVLVSDKSKSPKVKELINNFNARPMYEERLWGWYRILDYTKYSDQEVLTNRLGIKKGKNLSYLYHLARNKTWMIVNGEGLIALNDSLRIVKAGDVIQIDMEVKHSIKAIKNLEIIEIQTGTELFEEDIIRLISDWDEIEANCYMNVPE